MLERNSLILDMMNMMNELISDYVKSERKNGNLH